jgi:DNA-directed RNA polymerase specialized sigma24 family protein
MSDPSPRRPGWQLSRPAFERFLAQLDPDPSVAAGRYEGLRTKLARFFEWRGCAFPDELADETINRVIRRIDEGEAIRDISTYCHGVARLVLLESLKRDAKERLASEEFHRTVPAAEDDDLEQRVACLRRCLKELPVAQQVLVREYHHGEGAEKISRRKQLAARLGIGMNALRIRAFRLADRLQACVAGCVGRTGIREMKPR